MKLYLHALTVLLDMMLRHTQLILNWPRNSLLLWDTKIHYHDHINRSLGPAIHIKNRQIIQLSLSSNKKILCLFSHTKIMSQSQRYFHATCIIPFKNLGKHGRKLMGVYIQIIKPCNENFTGTEKGRLK
jgi:hypothetical protein